MTPAELRGWNAGVTAVLNLAREAAERIGRDDARHLHAGFAVEALRELADAGRDLLEADGALRTAPLNASGEPSL